jgi:hypothetical protein
LQSRFRADRAVRGRALSKNIQSPQMHFPRSSNEI